MVTTTDKGAHKIIGSVVVENADISLTNSLKCAQINL